MYDAGVVFALATNGVMGGRAMTDHTQDKWKKAVVSRLDKAIASHVAVASKEAESNARLADAAPDLLAALEAITDHLERIGDSLNDVPFIRSARAVIAKAKVA